ncbi:unnamed protein product [Adineta ricciae]|uniref:General transcription factor IIF subunit 2 n=1 Tax=Adineta ricciae TaxID=249248 RepID=A0A816G3G4_ADIRI|nr:unnamed protein product [Adineta ricciae]
MSANDLSPKIDVDVKRSTTGVWLVKMPKYLSQILNDYGDSCVNGEIGRLIKPPQSQLAKSSGSAERVQGVSFCLNDQIMKKIQERNPSKDFQMPPREHRFCLSSTADDVVRTVYTRTTNNSNSSTGEQIAIVGKVIQRAEVRPVENEQYMSMKRKQFESSKEPTRKALMINKKSNAPLPRRDHEENKERLRLKKLKGKRLRGSEDEVTTKLFEAFSKNQYISMSGLEEITNQPKNFLQQLVKMYCNYNNSGHTYELKPQFRGRSIAKDDDDDDDMDDDDDDDDDDDNSNNNNNDNK